MLRLTQAQMLLAIVEERGFVDWYVDRFMPDHLPDFHRAFSRNELVSMVRRGRQEAIVYDFDDPASQVHFVTLMWTMGPTFHHHPGFREIATARDQPGPARIERFYREVTDEQGASAVLAANDRYWFMTPPVREGYS
jgi:hypothetical protein